MEARRPHRLEPRYPVQCELAIAVPPSAATPYRARDVSRGGVFLVSDHALELFADVRVTLPIGGESYSVPARVVHVVSPERARENGIEPGMGLQFEPELPEEQDAILRFVETARRLDTRKRWPVRWEGGGDESAARADPILGYVYDAVDGERGPEELSDLLGLPLRTVEVLLAELAGMRVIELRARVPTLQMPPPRRPQPSAARTRELAPALRVELIELWRKLGELDHYQVLGLTRDAGWDEIREAFFARSKRFHPDAHYRRTIGDDLGKLERVFGRLSEAYGVLSRGAARVEYDRYLDQKRALSLRPPEPQQPTAAPGLAVSGPGAAGAASRQLWDARQNDEARRELIGALSAQASYEEKHQHWQEAAATWQRLCNEDPYDATAHRRAALAMHHAGMKVELALELAQRATHLVPNDAHNRRALGQLYLAAGMKRKARAELDMALALQTTTPTMPVGPH